MKKSETDGACSTYSGRRDMHPVFSWGNLRERDHMEDAGVDGSIITKWIFGKWD
jgi:hypothetical protein